MSDAQLIEFVRDMLATHTPDAVAMNTTGDPAEDARVLSLLSNAFPGQSFEIVDPATHVGGAIAKAAHETERRRGRPSQGRQRGTYAVWSDPDVHEWIRANGGGSYLERLAKTEMERSMWKSGPGCMPPGLSR